MKTFQYDEPVFQENMIKIKRGNKKREYDREEYARLKKFNKPVRNNNKRG